jgi:hypothetical protein
VGCLHAKPFCYQEFMVYELAIKAHCMMILNLAPFRVSEIDADYVFIAVTEVA